MGKQTPRKELHTAFKQLSSQNKSLIRNKTLKGNFAPQDLLEQLSELQVFGQTVTRYKTDLHLDSIVSERKKVNITLLIIGMFVAVVVYYKVHNPAWLKQALLAFSLGFPLAWAGIPYLIKMNAKRKLIDTDGVGFLSSLLFVLSDEIRPGELVKLDLFFGEIRPFKHKVRTQKNYKILTHRVIIRAFIGLVLSIVIYVILSKLYENIFPPVIPDIVSIVAVFGYAIFYRIFFAIASSAFGESPKVKSVFLKAPRFLVQAKLADGTLFHLELNYWLIQKTSFKKKVKFKQHRLHKKKQKHQAKVVTTLKLSFPGKQYDMKTGQFEHWFKHKAHLAGQKIAKTKLKPGDKRNTIVYQQIQVEKGEGRNPATLPYPTFQQLAQLVMEGGYNRLPGNQKLKTPSAESSKSTKKPVNTQKDNLTLLKGIGASSEKKLNDRGVYNFKQIAEMKPSTFEAILKKADLPVEKAKEWQTEAKSWK